MFNRVSLAVIVAFPLLFISISAQTRATISTSGTRLLKQPGRGASLLGPLPRGAEVEVENLFLDEDWTLVSIGDTEGWVSRKNIRVKMDDPWQRAVWLFMGTTPKTNGFVVRFYLNTSQIIRLGDNVRFWTKMVPDDRKAYFEFIMDRPPARKPSDFRFNSDLWEGNCRTDELMLVRSILYWKPNVISRPKVSRERSATSSNSAARMILLEACKAAER